MSANDTQVGGDHYKKASFQPWDWERYGVGGLEWTAIKYITRFRDKGGVEDLNKAIHFIDKLIEENTLNHRINRITNVHGADEEYKLYEANWKLDENQASAVYLLVFWFNADGLRHARFNVQELINAYSTSNVQPSEHVESATTK